MNLERKLTRLAVISYLIGMLTFITLVLHQYHPDHRLMFITAAGAVMYVTTILEMILLLAREE